MTTNRQTYDQAYLAQGNGDFVQCTDFTIDTNVNAKEVHTLRRPGSGVVLGVRESSVSFNLTVDGEGPERSFHSQMIRGVEVQLRAKIPGGEVLTLNGKYGNISVSAPLDDAVTYGISFVGKLETPAVA